MTPEISTLGRQEGHAVRRGLVAYDLLVRSILQDDHEYVPRRERRECKRHECDGSGEQAEQELFHYISP
jgi:hypothetical protein